MTTLVAISQKGLNSAITLNGVTVTQAADNNPVLETIGGAVDTDYLFTDVNATGIYTADVPFDWPTDFRDPSTATSLSVQLRYVAAGALTNIWNSLTAQLYDSTGATPLSNSVTIASAITTQTLTNSGVIAFTGLNTTAGAATWQSAVLRISWDISKSMGGDTVPKQVTAGEITGTYVAQAFLESSVSANSTITGDVTTDIRLAASIASETSVIDSNLNVGIVLVAEAMSAETTTTGDLTVPKPLDANLFAESSATGSIDTQIYASAAGLAESSVSGDLTTEIPLLGNAMSAATTATANLTATITFEASISASSTIAANTVDTSIIMAAAPTAVTTATSALTTEIPLLGNAMSAATTANANLTATITFEASISASSTIGGSLDIFGNLSATDVIDTIVADGQVFVNGDVSILEPLDIFGLESDVIITTNVPGILESNTYGPDTFTADVDVIVNSDLAVIELGVNDSFVADGIVIVNVDAPIVEPVIDTATADVDVIVNSTSVAIVEDTIDIFATDADVIINSTSFAISEEPVEDTFASDVNVIVNVSPITVSEYSGENLLLFSQGINSGFWVKSQIYSILVNNALAPDGSITAEGIVPNTSLNSHYYEQLVSNLPAGVEYTTSAYFKKNNGNYVTLYVYGNGTAAHGVKINLITGVGTLETTAQFSGTTTDWGTESVGNGWHKVWITGYPDTVATSRTVRVYSHYEDGSSFTFAGDNVTPDHYSWGFHLRETGLDSADTYVVTNGSAIQYNDQFVGDSVLVVSIDAPMTESGLELGVVLADVIINGSASLTEQPIEDIFGLESDVIITTNVPGILESNTYGPDTFVADVNVIVNSTSFDLNEEPVEDTFVSDTDVIINGNVSPTEPQDYLAAPGIVIINGDAPIIEPIDTIVVNVDVIVNSTSFAISEEPVEDTFGLDSDVIVTTNIPGILESNTYGPDTFVSDGIVIVNVDAPIVEPIDTIVSDGIVIVNADLTTTEDIDTIASDVDVIVNSTSFAISEEPVEDTFAGDVDVIVNSSSVALKELGATNLLTYSEELTEWNGTGVSLVSGIGDPFGNPTAEFVLGTGVGGYLTQYVVYETGARYTFSLYAKNGPDPAGMETIGSRVLGQAFNSGGNDIWPVFNLTTGVVTTEPGYDAPENAYMENVGQGWWRCVYTVTCTDAAYMVSANRNEFIKTPTYAGGQTRYARIWGVQLEKQYDVTSTKAGVYVKTTNEPITQDLNYTPKQDSIASDVDVVVNGDAPLTEPSVDNLYINGRTRITGSIGAIEGQDVAFIWATEVPVILGTLAAVDDADILKIYGTTYGDIGRPEFTGGFRLGVTTRKVIGRITPIQEVVVTKPRVKTIRGYRPSSNKNNIIA